ncbi:DNA ligase 1 [Condylostylus longicornis]|uniref:DNA ligase 1 n=1 Tax=Condylostylus longicornis TaxID=2530218 RepID=UPI00244DE7D1|nr:DNA ligase 1 [Condylostylus longicornis]
MSSGEEDGNFSNGSKFTKATVNFMNVWTTIETLAGNDIRKKYTPYEGYADKNDILKMFKPVPITRRDSFVADDKKDSKDDLGFKNKLTDSKRSGSPIKSSKSKSEISNAKKLGFSIGCKKPKKRRKFHDIQIDIPKEYVDIIGCNFALPRITARIEKLMGSNVIRLTDRKFMNEVRARMQKDYEIQLKKRITQREVKESERERNLILAGKSDVVPDDQSDHPIFIVNKAANEVITGRRAKLKTNRERNAERLAIQFAKWEKEKMRYEQLEIENQEKRTLEEQNEKALVTNYAKEDKKKGLDLLRITDQNWRNGEETLREFLEKENIRMKSKSIKIPTPFLSDPDDIQNVVKARKMFRDLEKKVREDLATKTASAGDSKAARKALFEAGTKLKEVKENKNKFETDLSDSDISLMEKIEFDTDQNRQDKINELQNNIEEDIRKELIMASDQYKSLYFEDPKIAKLRATDTIKKLYKLAKEIITGETEPISEGEEEEEQINVEDDEISDLEKEDNDENDFNEQQPVQGENEEDEEE